MHKYLSTDEATGGLRLVYEDLWDGQHERTEYRVMSDRTGGHQLRNMQDLDDREVYGCAPALYVKLGPWGEQTVPVWTEETAVGVTVKTPCAKAASRRRKCALCA